METYLQRKLRERGPMEKLSYLKPYSGGPIPSGWCICCPKCEIWKMRPNEIAGIEVFVCSGGKGLASDGSDRCGHVMSDLEVRAHKGLYLVEE